jgi:protein involved in polysaccharide export with SLBB domain
VLLLPPHLLHGNASQSYFPYFLVDRTPAVPLKIVVSIIPVRKNAVFSQGFTCRGASMHSIQSMALILATFAIFAHANLSARPQQSSGAGATSATQGGGPDGSHGVEHPVPAERNPRYRLNRSDVLVLTFALSPEFNQTVTVQPDGYITLQGAGSINVLGLSVPETVLAVKNAYAKILHEPIIDVDLTDFQKAYFIVTGQVTKPGQYDLRYDITVSEAIAIAGGFLPTAKTQVFLYRRSATGWVEAKELKLKNFLHGKDVAEDAAMRPGDMIFVPEKTITKIRKYIPYSVGVPLSTTPSVY